MLWTIAKFLTPDKVLQITFFELLVLAVLESMVDNRDKYEHKSMALTWTATFFVIAGYSLLMNL